MGVKSGQNCIQTAVTYSKEVQEKRIFGSFTSKMNQKMVKKEKRESMHLYASEIEWVVMNFIRPCVHDCTEDELIQKSRALQPAYQNDSHMRDELVEELQKAPLSGVLGAFRRRTLLCFCVSRDRGYPQALAH